MTNTKFDYAITHHLRERFIQRSDKKFEHLQTCKQEDCNVCGSLMKLIHTEIAFDRKNIDKEIIRRVNLSDENRSYLNNSEFMSRHYERYGFDKRFEFLIHDDLVFVVVIEDGSKIIVTCVESKTHIAGKSYLSKVKYKKTKTKIEY